MRGLGRSQNSPLVQTQALQPMLTVALCFGGNIVVSCYGKLIPSARYNTSLFQLSIPPLGWNSCDPSWQSPVWARQGAAMFPTP